MRLLHSWAAWMRLWYCCFVAECGWRLQGGLFDGGVWNLGSDSADGLCGVLTRDSWGSDSIGALGF